MALDNLASISFTTEELDKIKLAIKDIDTVLEGKAINLTPDERQRFARVSYEMLPWVQKCYGYMKTEPTLVPAYIDMTELDKDFKVRTDIDPNYTSLRSTFEKLDDLMLLLGHDIYNNCIAFYKAVKAASQANVPGSTSIYQDLAQQFPGRPKSAGDTK